MAPERGRTGKTMGSAVATPLFALASTHLPRWVRHLEPLLHFDYWEDVVWAAGAALLAFVAGRGVARLLFFIVNRWTRRSATRIDDALVRHLRAPVRWLLPLLSVAWALSVVDLSETAHEMLRQCFVVAIILTVGWLLFRVVHVLEEAVATRLLVDGAVSADSSGNYTQLQTFRNIAGFLIAVVSVGLALLSFAGVRQIGTSVLASASVIGVVVGFAAQRSIATILAGVTIAVAQPIRIGDVVVVENQGGTIEEITLTYVVVRLWDLRRLIVPVNTFLEKPFENWSRGSTELLGSVLIYFDHSLPLEAVRAEFTRLLEASPYWDHKISSLQVTDTTERTIVIRAQMSAADAASTWNLRCEIREKLVEFVQGKHQAALPRQRTAAG
jgi:small-conductance mechanosensitive channel